MKCKGGGLKSPDICSEPCGAGLNAGFYACDDGCSANCTLEENY